MTLNELQRIKQWHVEHRTAHPLEYHLWDLVLTLWMLGWVGWFPLCAFGEPLTAWVCLIGIFMPRLYVAWRARAHAHRTLRCDWLDQRR
jgi:hypothetical protein